MTDENGNRCQHYGYSPFGRDVHKEDDTSLPLSSFTVSDFNVSNRFTGQILDEETGLYYYGARYYDPLLARFIQSDTVIPDPGSSQALNRYSYCYNNPLMFSDPSGNIPFLNEGISAAAMFVAENWNNIAGTINGAMDGYNATNQALRGGQADQYSRWAGSDERQENGNGIVFGMTIQGAIMGWNTSASSLSAMKTGDLGTHDVYVKTYNEFRDNEFSWQRVKAKQRGYDPKIYGEYLYDDWSKPYNRCHTNTLHDDTGLERKSSWTVLGDFLDGTGPEYRLYNQESSWTRRLKSHPLIRRKINNFIISGKNTARSSINFGKNEFIEIKAWANSAWHGPGSIDSITISRNESGVLDIYLYNSVNEASWTKYVESVGGQKAEHSRATKPQHGTFHQIFYWSERE